jgi:transcriptional regulator with XRE-family HTH domain
MEPTQIRKNIKRLRNVKGMTQKEMSKALFIDERTYSNFERGIKKTIDVKLLLAISNVLETDVSELITNTGTKKERNISVEEKLKQILDEINELKASCVSELKEIKEGLRTGKTS